MKKVIGAICELSVIGATAGAICAGVLFVIGVVVGTSMPFLFDVCAFGFGFIFIGTLVICGLSRLSYVLAL